MKMLHATTLTFTAFFVAAVLDYAFVVAMSWWLPPDAYGTLGVALTWFLLLSFFVASGFPMALAKFLSEQAEAPPGLLRFAMRANLLAAVCLASIFLGLTFYGPLSPGPGYGRLVWSVATAVVLLAVGSTLQFALQGRLAFVPFALLHASKSFNKLLFGAGLVLLGLGATGGTVGLVVGGAVLIATAWAILGRWHPDVLRKGDLAPAERRRFLRYTASVLAGSLALTLLMSLDLLAVKYLAPAGESNLMAARYQTATLLTKAPLWAVLAGLSVLFPMLSRASRQDPAAASRLLRAVLRWMALALAPLAVILMIFPRAMLGVMFPTVYAAAAPVLAVSAVGMGALALALVLTRALQATDRARSPGMSLAVSVALQAALLVALVPRWGALGAAVATAIASIAGAALVLGAAARPFELRLRWGDAVAFATSLALMAAVFAALAPEGRWMTLVDLALAGAAYVTAIVMLGLVRPHERRAILKRVLPRDAETAPVEA